MYIVYPLICNCPTINYLKKKKIYTYYVPTSLHQIGYYSVSILPFMYNTRCISKNNFETRTHIHTMQLINEYNYLCEIWYTQIQAIQCKVICILEMLLGSPFSISFLCSDLFFRACLNLIKQCRQFFFQHRKIENLIIFLCFGHNMES